MSEQIVAQSTQEVKLLELVNRADKLISALATDVDEDEPLGQAIFKWLLDAEIATYGCGCVLPEHHCPDCEAAARAVHGSEDGELPF